MLIQSEWIQGETPRPPQCPYVPSASARTLHSADPRVWPFCRPIHLQSAGRRPRTYRIGSSSSVRSKTIWTGNFWRSPRFSRFYRQSTRATTLSPSWMPQHELFRDAFWLNVNRPLPMMSRPELCSPLSRMRSNDPKANNKPIPLNPAERLWINTKTERNTPSHSSIELYVPSNSERPREGVCEWEWPEALNFMSREFKAS